ncbi:MAG: chorismate synthase [Eubacteriales bacterium]|nr:chorismate synthase [Eubacteriales bacterium]MDD4583808.1 chorismate synthase [Eubacteriales bacterium]
MSNVWGHKIKVSIFGESHGEGIGIVIGGLPEGETINLNEIIKDMARRAPGNNEQSSQRQEPDQVKILSGLFKGKTTGAPLCGIIFNQDYRSEDYEQSLPRPGHADLVAFMKYQGYNDYRGGGHFSGRLTAPLTFAGSIAKQILVKRSIKIGAHIKQIADVYDQSLITVDKEILSSFTDSSFPLIDQSVREGMVRVIKKAKDEGDSVGGIIECAAVGLPVGMGSPFFLSMESNIAAMMFSIPAVKGISFGKGFDFALMRGSEANDPIVLDNGMITMSSNHNGGINGGITNGMPLIFQVAVKPTPSISIRQDTVNLEKMKRAVIKVRGRHDPCIVPRAVPVIEAGLALCLLDAWYLEGRK